MFREIKQDFIDHQFCGLSKKYSKKRKTTTTTTKHKQKQDKKKKKNIIGHTQ